eukprot:8476674-Karenia_brevis.AAC.1
MRDSRRATILGNPASKPRRATILGASRPNITRRAAILGLGLPRRATILGAPKGRRSITAT